MSSSSSPTPSELDECSPLPCPPHNARPAIRPLRPGLSSRDPLERHPARARGPHGISRHSHPQGQTRGTGHPAAPATGIDYLGIIRAKHEEAARRNRIRYDALARRDGEDEPRTGGETAVPAAQISAVLAWAARLTAGPGRAEPSRPPPTSPPRPPSWNASPASASGRLAPGRHRRRPAGRGPRPPGRRCRRPAAPPPASPPPERTSDMIDLKNHYGFTQHPVRQGPRPVHALPLPRPRRGRRPHHLVRPRARPRRKTGEVGHG